MISLLCCCCCYTPDVNVFILSGVYSDIYTGKDTVSIRLYDAFYNDDNFVYTKVYDDPFNQYSSSYYDSLIPSLDGYVDIAKEWFFSRHSPLYFLDSITRTNSKEIKLTFKVSENA